MTVGKAIHRTRLGAPCVEDELVVGLGPTVATKPAWPPRFSWLPRAAWLIPPSRPLRGCPARHPTSNAGVRGLRLGT
eukprot:1219824-Lingulodinium_polyedra.AAC.1